MTRRLLAVSIAALAAAGCSGSSASKSLSAGTYVISNGATQSDTCNALGNLASTDGTTFQVVSVSTSAIQFQFGSDPAFTATRAGSTFTVTATQDYDWTNTGTSGLAHPYNCMEHDVFSFGGTITGHNQLSITEDIQYTDTTGTAADCIAAANSAFNSTLTTWPCESRGTFDGSKQ